MRAHKHTHAHLSHEHTQIQLLQRIRDARAELDRRSGGDPARAAAEQRDLRRASSGGRTESVRR
jgi:hypothetical protein